MEIVVPIEGECCCIVHWEYITSVTELHIVANASTREEIYFVYNGSLHVYNRTGPLSHLPLPFLSPMDRVCCFCVYMYPSTSGLGTLQATRNAYSINDSDDEEAVPENPTLYLPTNMLLSLESGIFLEGEIHFDEMKLISQHPMEVVTTSVRSNGFILPYLESMHVLSSRSSEQIGENYRVFDILGGNSSFGIQLFQLRKVDEMAALEQQRQNLLCYKQKNSFDRLVDVNKVVILEGIVILRVISFFKNIYISS